MENKTIQIYPFNRVEGDLEIHLEVDEGIVSDARSAGIMYRGFENLLVGRAALDGLVITPRICGICSTSHLKAAARALDMFFNVRLPDNAVRIRNITLMAEQLQNDFRHAFLLFMSDFTNPIYDRQPLFEEALKRYKPLSGETVLQTVRETKKLLEIIAILGGQWPHSSFMIPGGVVCVPSANDIMQCLFLLRNFQQWFEKRVLGCGVERLLAVKSRADLDAWLQESESHRQSDLGFYMRFATQAGLDKIGRGYSNFISFGGLDLPVNTEVKSPAGGGQYLSAGFWRNGELNPLRQENITEDISYSWFHDAGSVAKHPFEGTTTPYATGKESNKYSWAKAPRYEGLPAETGPLAEMIVSSNALFRDLIAKDGPSVFTRELARLVRAAGLIPVMKQWLQETAACKEDFYRDYPSKENGDGYGLIEAPRGALGHWVKIDDGKIEKYQIITPTAWNASPRDAEGLLGPLEEAILGTQIKKLDNPVEIDHIIRSFDPCLVCTVHAIAAS
jgi:hydrogenase large subunit